MSQLAQMQATDGMDVIVAHSIRPDTPSPDALERLFPDPISRIVVPMTTEVSPAADLRSLASLVRLLRDRSPDVIHLHSSKAGALGRIAARRLGLQDRTFYSPRGFAFLREDVPPSRRRSYLVFEWIAARLGGALVACSSSEADLARLRLGHKRVLLVENCIDLDALPAPGGGRRERVRVATSGRICYQKAPWRFRALSAAMAEKAVDLVWIGDGELRGELEAPPAPRNIRVTGWRSRAEVYRELAQSDVFVLPSLWEGMPLALIEAQALGLPAVVSDVTGNRDVVRNGATGFVCGTEADFVEKTRLLVSDAALRSTMGAAARRMALERFSTRRMHLEMLAAYRTRAGS